MYIIPLNLLQYSYWLSTLLYWVFFNKHYKKALQKQFENEITLNIGGNQVTANIYLQCNPTCLFNMFTGAFPVKWIQNCSLSVGQSTVPHNLKDIMAQAIHFQFDCLKILFNQNGICFLKVW